MSEGMCFLRNPSLLGGFELLLLFKPSIRSNCNNRFFKDLTSSLKPLFVCLSHPYKLYETIFSNFKRFSSSNSHNLGNYVFFVFGCAVTKSAYSIKVISMTHALGIASWKRKTIKKEKVIIW